MIYYLRILEADIKNQVEMKEIIKKEYLRERENYSNPNYQADISSKEINTWAVTFVKKLNHS